MNVQDNAPKSEESKPETTETTLLVSDYHKKLKKQWEQDHTTPAPLIDSGNGVAVWLNRKQRKTQESLIRKANKRRAPVTVPAQLPETKEENAVITTDEPTP